MMNRRDFLKTAGGLGLILGLPSLTLGQEESPEWLRQALARMKKENKFGIAIRVPSDPDARATLAARLLELVESEKDEAVQLLCSAVLVCLGDKTFPGRDDEGIALFDDSGKRVDGAKSIDSLFALIEKRLETRAAALRTDEIRATIENLSGDLEESSKAAAELEKLAPTIAPLLVFEARRTEGVVRDHLRAVLLRHATPAARLPYGVECRERTGCGSDSMSKCGMSRVPGPGRKFLHFLAKT